MRQAWLSLQHNEKNQRIGADTDYSDVIPPRQLSREQAVLLGANEKHRRVRTSLNELFFATYDILVHSPQSHKDLERTNLATLYNQLRSEVCSIHGVNELDEEGWEYCQGQTVFRAIHGRYDAGYYAYIL